VGIRALFCQQKVVFLEIAIKESCNGLHWILCAKPPTVNELCLAARKGIGNGKCQCRKRTRKKGADSFLKVCFLSLKNIGLKTI